MKVFRLGVLLLAGCTTSSSTHEDEKLKSVVLRTTTTTEDSYGGGCGHRQSRSRVLSLRDPQGNILLDKVDLSIRSGDGKWLLASSWGKEQHNAMHLIDLDQGSLRESISMSGGADSHASARKPVPDSEGRRFLFCWEEFSQGVKTNLVGISASRLLMASFSDEGAKVEALYEQNPWLLNVPEGAWSPDQNVVAVLAQSPLGVPQETKLHLIDLRTRQVERNVATSARNRDDLRIVWDGQRPRLHETR